MVPEKYVIPVMITVIPSPESRLIVQGTVNAQQDLLEPCAKYDEEIWRSGMASAKKVIGNSIFLCVYFLVVITVYA